VREELILRARRQSIVGYLKALGIKGKNENGRFICCSPLRGETTASFSVSLEKNLWYDFGAGFGGDLITLIEKLNGYDFKKAVRYIEGLDISGADDDDEESAVSLSSHKEVKTEVPPDTGQSKKGRLTVEKYFKALGLPYYPRIEAFPLSYKKPNSTSPSRNYIGFPVPTPAERFGIECRGFDITSQGITPRHRRMNLGRKMPWILMRDPERFLVTESITDSLAGEVILGNTQISLVALNGTGNVKYLPNYIHNGSEVLLGMDNDGEQNEYIGQQTEAEAEKLLLSKRCHISHITNHVDAGVKDLFRLLQLETKHK